VFGIANPVSSKATHGHFILLLITTALYSIIFAMGGVIVREAEVGYKTPDNTCVVA